MCTITWECGATASFFTDAVSGMGYFRFTNLPEALSVELETPRYEDNGSEVQKVVAPRTHLLTRLGYKTEKSPAATTRLSTGRKHTAKWLTK